MTPLEKVLLKYCDTYNFTSESPYDDFKKFTIIGLKTNYEEIIKLINLDLLNPQEILDLQIEQISKQLKEELNSRLKKNEKL